MTGKRGDRKFNKQRGLERERRRRANSGEYTGPTTPGPDGRPRPDWSNVDFDSLSRDDARKAKRALLIMHIGIRARQAVEFVEWGLSSHQIEPGSRLALDDKAVPFASTVPDLVSTTGRYPAMNACDNIVGAAEVASVSIRKGQLRTSSVSILCRTAMESAAKTIWLLSPTDTDGRVRRCLGFTEVEDLRQKQFNDIEDEVLSGRTDRFAAADRADFDRNTTLFEERMRLVSDLPKGQRKRPDSNILELLKSVENWVDAEYPRQPDPELDKIKVPRGAESFYSLGSGLVHGYKWLNNYINKDTLAVAEVDLIEIIVDALGAALRMTECAVALFEAQSIGTSPNPSRRRAYPEGIAALVDRWAPLYRLSVAS
ncbi:MAG: hypothetical protein KDB26_16215 [Microthrixaceae bacterium]|nr:hypothetical protein [Microthrixaceae bacterium]